MSDPPTNTSNLPRLSSCDACGGVDKDEGLPFASLVAGWSPTQAHEGERYLLNLCKPCFLMVYGDLKFQRRLNTPLNYLDEGMRGFGMANVDGPSSITFGEFLP